MALAGLPWLLAACPSARLSASQCPDGTPLPCRTTPARAPAANSVAVLYFENLSPDTADAFARHWLWAPVRGDARFQSFLASLRS